MTTAPASLKVCIDVSAAVHQRAGLGRYAQELVKGLVDLGRGEVAAPTGEETLPLQITAFYHQRGEARLDPPLDRLPRLTPRLSVRPWRLTTALAHFTHVSMDRLFGDADLFHATEHLLPRLKTTRSVFTLHDLIFQFDPDSHKPLNIAFLKTMMPRFLKAADAIIAVSECSKRDAINLYGIPADKIHVIYEGVDPRFMPIADPDRLSQIARNTTCPIVSSPRRHDRAAQNLPLLFESPRRPKTSSSRANSAG
jgi:glycosyltransferase involved in cell wall biosynthesis